MDLRKGKPFLFPLYPSIILPQQPANSKSLFPHNSVIIAAGIPITITSILKDRPLKGRYRDLTYPSTFVPFYLYGTPTNLNIDHILLRAPNIQLSAENITLDLTGSDSGDSTKSMFSLLTGSSSSSKSSSGGTKNLPADALSKGAILTLEGISEAAMQPFQSTEGPLGDTLTSDSNFFFRPGQTFPVTIYEDGKEAGTPGPGLLDDVLAGKAKVLGKGTVTLGEGRYVDSVLMNQDPFEVKEGSEKFKAWKKVFDSIGKELE